MWGALLLVLAICGYLLVGLLIAALNPYQTTKTIFVKTIFFWLPAIFSDPVFNWVTK